MAIDAVNLSAQPSMVVISDLVEGWPPHWESSTREGTDVVEAGPQVCERVAFGTPLAGKEYRERVAVLARIIQQG